MTDAAHLLTDFASMLISLFSLWMSSRPATKTMNFGWHRAGEGPGWDEGGVGGGGGLRCKFLGECTGSLRKARRVTWVGEEDVNHDFRPLGAPSLMGEPWSPVPWEFPPCRKGESTFLRVQAVFI